METSALTFARPLVLQALWLAPLFAALYWWAERRRRELLGRIVAPKLRAQLTANASPARRVFRASCVLAALALLVVALAGPQMGYDTLEVPHRGRDVIIAMDVSRSMLAPDVAPSRLERAKLLAEDLIADLGADRVGLIAFAGSAFLQAPLTLDHGAVLAALDEMDTTLIPKGGTNIAAAIREAEQAFGKAEGFSRALVIISDGEELDADGVAAAKQAAANGIRVFTVGVGSPEGSEIPLAPGEFVRDPSGKVVQSRLDAARMQQIAEAGGGFYAPLDADTAQRLVSEGVSKLAEADITTSASRRPVERYQWPLSAAIALLALQALVGERRRRPLAATVASLLLLGASSGWAAPAGLSAYEKGDYGQARSAFEQRLKMEPGSASLQFNAGAAAYRLKDYSKASEYFSRAMLAEDPAVRSASEFNLANTLFRQGQGQEDKKKKIADWKDAIAKYDSALKTRPGYTEAQENKERVQQLLEELQKEEQKDQQKQNKDQQKPDQNKDQQKDKQDKQDQQNKQGQENKDQQKQQEQKEKQDQQQGGGKDDKKDQNDQQQKQDQNKDQQNKQGQENKEQEKQQEQKEKQDQQQGGGQKKEQEGQKDQENKPSADAGNKRDEQKKDQKDQGKGDEKEEQGQQKQDQQQGEGKEPDQKKDQGKEDQKDQQQGQKGEEQKDQQGSEEGNPAEARPQGQPGEKPAPVPQPTGEKKQGELRGGEQSDQAKKEAQAMAEAAEEKEGEMSENQARALLRSLQGEEERVNLLERKNFQEVSRDW